MSGNRPARFGKGPTEKDPHHGHLACGLLHSEVRARETDRPKGRHRALARPYGVSLLPVTRRTWAPVGHTPVIRHRFKWKRASMAAALCYVSEVSPIS